MNDRTRGALDGQGENPQAPQKKVPDPAREALETQARQLNEEFASLTADERIRRAHEIFGRELVATTSFGRDAGLLLHHLHRVDVPIRVYFIDTSFHFPETLAYRDTLTSAYKLDLNEVRSADPTNRRYSSTNPDGDRRSGDFTLSISDTVACCGVNKVAVQAAFLGRTDVKAFLAGLRRDQSDSRKETPFVHVQKGKIKICPFADWPQDDVELYLKIWEVPEHPLAAQGYTSIGCSPITCTQKPAGAGDSRSGRWAGDAKTECGLHTDYEP